MLATAYPLLEILWTMLIFFSFVVWIWVLFTVFADVFRRSDISGWAKTAWIVFVVLLPYLGVFVYIIVEHRGMTERSVERQRDAVVQVGDYVRSIAGGSDPTAQIARASTLLEEGVIDRVDFERIKQKALLA